VRVLPKRHRLGLGLLGLWIRKLEEKEKMHSAMEARPKKEGWNK
jgi:hypothetical protein